MDDNDICLSIILRFQVNVLDFCNWFTCNFDNSYDDYLKFAKVHNYTLSAKILDEFSFKFLVASLIWKGLI